MTPPVAASQPLAAAMGFGGLASPAVPTPAGPPGRPGAAVTPLLPVVAVAFQRRQADAWLAARVGRVQPDPFEVLFERHWGDVHTYCLGILGSADEAQDAAQDAMLRAYRRLWRTKDVRAARPLLFAIARNACVDRLRERRRDAGPVEEHHLPPAGGADDAAATRGRIGLLVSDLHALSERQRTALVLREACGLSYDEIAGTLDTTSLRVKSLISEARQALSARRTGRDLSCEDYRDAVRNARGRLRNQSLLAHRASCGRCGEAPIAVFGLALPPLLVWLARGARHAVQTAVAGLPAPAAKLAAAGSAALIAVGPATDAFERGSAAPAAPVHVAAPTPQRSEAAPAAAGRAAPAHRDAGRPAPRRARNGAAAPVRKEAPASPARPTAPAPAPEPQAPARVPGVPGVPERAETVTETVRRPVERIAGALGELPDRRVVQTATAQAEALAAEAAPAPAGVLRRP